MENIKFRGKPQERKLDDDFVTILGDNYRDGFVYGQLNFDDCGNYWIVGNIIESSTDYIAHEYWVPVISETVGRYYGRKDKYGVEIYEGSILEIVMDDGIKTKVVCKFGTVRRLILGNVVEITGFYFERAADGKKTFPIINNYLDKSDTEIWEVVGNIYDYPKLLREG